MSDRRAARARWARRIPPIIVAIAVAALAIQLISTHHRSTTPRDAPESRVPVADYGTRREIGTSGNRGNPRALFHGAYPSGDETQELRIGGIPARFSGYTTWLRSVKRVPARTLVDGYQGDYLRLQVTIFNRDTEEQHVCACDFNVWTRTHGRREADVVGAPTVSDDSDIRSGGRLDGNVYLYVGKVRGPYFVVYDPDAHALSADDHAIGVWQVPA